MKLQTIVFVEPNGYAAPRRIFGVGRVNSLTIGQVVTDDIAGPAVIASLECDTRSGVLVIRKKPKDGGNPEAARAWNGGTGESQRHTADFALINIGTAQCYGLDADNVQPAKGQGKQG